MTHTKLTRLLIQTTAALTLACAAHAGSASSPVGKSSQPVAAKEESELDKLWSMFTLYKNDDNAFIQELAFTGRYQGQYYAIDGEENSDDDYDHRRFRLGLKAKLLDKRLLFSGEMFSEFNPGGEFYSGLKSFHLTYVLSDALSIRVGKMQPTFTTEFATSSTQHIYFERNALVNQFKNDYSTGISLDGKSDKLTYSLTAITNTPDKEFGTFDGGYSIFAHIGYDFKEALGLKKATWRLDFMHSEHDENDTLLTAFDNGVATSIDLKQGAYGLTAEVLAGFGPSNNFGLILTPTYDITKKLQAIGRFQVFSSDEPKGQSPQKRYEGSIGAPKGDLYSAAYLGLNYYIYGQKLKLMNGVEYANMSGGESSWTWLSGLRVNW